MNNDVLDEQFTPQREGPVRCREKLGGLIKKYNRWLKKLQAKEVMPGIPPPPRRRAEIFCPTIRKPAFQADAI